MIYIDGIIHYPKSNEEWNELEKKASYVKALLIIHYIKRLNIIDKEKKEVLKNVIEKLKQSSC